MATDKELIAQAEKARTNLAEGVAPTVARGDEPVPLRTDPVAARKAMFAKADALRETEVANSAEVDPAVVAQLQAEAAGGTAPAPTATPAPAPTAAAPSHEYVTIPGADGTQISVPQSDIDREGSVEQYVARRQRDEAEAAQRIALATTQQELAQTKRQLEEYQREHPAVQGGPATSPDVPSGRTPAESGDPEPELEELAETLAQQIYSGDEGDARAAILQLLQRSRGQTLSPAVIEQQVRTVLAAHAQPQPTTPTPVSPAPVVANPRMEAINAQINDMSLREYPDVCADKLARDTTFAYFKELVAKPENKDRMVVDVARDACEWGRSKFFPDPRAQVLERKRGLPGRMTASGATTTPAGQEEPLTPAQIVQLQRDHRNFGRQIHH